MPPEDTPPNTRTAALPTESVGASQMEETPAWPPLLPACPLEQGTQAMAAAPPIGSPLPNHVGIKVPPLPSSQTPWGAGLHLEEPRRSAQRARFLPFLTVLGAGGTLREQSGEPCPDHVRLMTKGTLHPNEI